MLTRVTISDFDLRQIVIGFEALLESIVEQAGLDDASPSFAPSDEQIDRSIANDASTPQSIVDFWRRRQYATVESIYHIMTISDPVLDVPRFYTLVDRTWPETASPNMSLNGQNPVHANLFLLACRANSPALIRRLYYRKSAALALTQLLRTTCNAEEPLEGLRALIQTLRKHFDMSDLYDGTFIDVLYTSKNIDLVVELCASIVFRKDDCGWKITFNEHEYTRLDMFIAKDIEKIRNIMMQFVQRGQDETFRRILEHPQCYFRGLLSWGLLHDIDDHFESVFRSAKHYIRLCYRLDTHDGDVDDIHQTQSRKTRRWSNSHLQQFIHGTSESDIVRKEVLCRTLVDMLDYSIERGACERHEIVIACLNLNMVLEPFTRTEALLHDALNEFAHDIFIDIVEHARDNDADRWALIEPILTDWDWHFSDNEYDAYEPYFETMTNFLLSMFRSVTPSNTDHWLEQWTNEPVWARLVEGCIEELKWPVSDVRALLRILARPKARRLCDLLIDRL